MNELLILTNPPKINRLFGWFQLDGLLSSDDPDPSNSGGPGPRSFDFCTDGQLHLRTCLLPEANRNRIQLPSHFRRFFDLRKEFRHFYKTNEAINGVKDILECILYCRA